MQEQERPNLASPKAKALLAAASIVPEATGMVEYRSEGRLLIIGASEAVAQVLPRLSNKLKVRALLTSGADNPPEEVAFEASQRKDIKVSGYLGDYEITSAAPLQRADIVIDLHDTPLLQMPLKPAGYFAPGADAHAIKEAVANAAELIGKFDKPQYFNYKPNICAHSASELEGCRNCIDACPAEAIISFEGKVQVNPMLCQGGGTCATVCPTGAITYRYPSANDTLDRVRKMLRAYHEAGGKNAQLVLHAQAHEPQASGTEQLPVALEELASVGLEIWLSALAFGARGVHLARDPQTHDSVIATLQAQMDIANAILTGLKFEPAVQWLNNEDLRAQVPDIKHATYGATGGKREILFAAIDHLTESAGKLNYEVPARIDLPANAPLGAIKVDTEGCTLCMSCVSVCPAKALSDGGGEPALRFFEVNCVQCGLCETACPEQVITRQSRLVTDPALRRAAATLNREEPFLCVRCSKPFATKSVIDRMGEKLAGHHMFQDEASRNRLKMCGDCRVLDMMAKDA